MTAPSRAVNIRGSLEEGTTARPAFTFKRFAFLGDTVLGVCLPQMLPGTRPSCDGRSTTWPSYTSQWLKNSSLAEAALSLGSGWVLYCKRADWWGAYRPVERDEEVATPVGTRSSGLATRFSIASVRIGGARIDQYSGCNTQ
jgi:hypothetical protein